MCHTSISTYSIPYQTKYCVHCTRNWVTTKLFCETGRVSDVRRLRNNGPNFDARIIAWFKNSVISFPRCHLCVSNDCGSRMDEFECGGGAFIRSNLVSYLYIVRTRRSPIAMECNRKAVQCDAIRLLFHLEIIELFMCDQQYTYSNVALRKGQIRIGRMTQ